MQQIIWKTDEVWIDKLYEIWKNEAPQMEHFRIEVYVLNKALRKKNLMW